jgi:lipopolysaccharide export system protein LptA
VKRLELALIVFGAAFLAVVIISFRPGRQPRAASEGESRVPPARDAGPATTLSSGFDFTESVKGRPLFRVKAEKTAGFGAPAPASAPQLYAGENVTLTLYPDDGQPVTVRAEKAEYDARTQSAKLEGNVRWTDDKGGLAETARGFFSSTERAFDVPGPLHVSRGGFDLRARSGRYDAGSRVLALSGPIDGSGMGVSSAPLSTLQADTATYRRDEGLFELSGHVRASSGEGDTLESDRLALKLRQPEGGLAWARAGGTVHGVLAGRRVPGARAVTSPFAGDEADFFFDDAGELKSLTLSGAPASGEQGGRKVTARTIDLEFANRRAVAAHAKGEVAVEAGGDRATAEQGDLTLAPDGTVEGLSLTGHAALAGPGRSGRADRAVEIPSRNVWILTGDARSSATVEQEGSRASAPRIEIDDRRKVVKAEGGGVRAVLAPARDARANATLVGDPGRPTFAKADRMVFDQTARTAILSGGAALWQDASSLFGRDITLNDAERSVVADGDVRAILAPGSTGARPGERSPTALTAGRLIYREGAEGSGPGPGRVALDGGMTAARGPWRASGKSGIAFLGKDRKVEKLEISGNVSLADSSTGRTGQGEHALDFPEEGRTILEGTPARVSDREGNRVSGATLTITERGHRVEVTAPEGGKTETIHQTHANR